MQIVATQSFYLIKHVLFIVLRYSYLNCLCVVLLTIISIFVYSYSLYFYNKLIHSTIYTIHSIKLSFNKHVGGFFISSKLPSIIIPTPTNEISSVLTIELHKLNLIYLYYPFLLLYSDEMYLGFDVNTVKVLFFNKVIFWTFLIGIL